MISRIIPIVFLAMMVSACSSHMAIETGLDTRAYHNASCPKGIPCKSTLVVGEEAKETVLPPANLTDSWKGPPATPLSKPKAKNEKKSTETEVKLSPTRNIFILREKPASPPAKQKSIPPLTSGGPAKKAVSTKKPDEIPAKSESKAAPAASGPPPINLIPPPVKK